MQKYFLFFLLFLSVLFESSITTIPIVLDLLIIFYILDRKSSSFVIAFIAGIFLDIFAVRNIGQSSIFLIVFLFILSLYERKFEVTTNYFILVASFIGSLLYLLVSFQTIVIWQAIVSSLFTLITYFLLKKFFWNESNT